MAKNQQTWTIAGVLSWTRNYFEQKGIDSARLDAELLLAHVLKCDRISLYTHFDKPLKEDERAAYRALVRRRAAREPVAYILGRREFYGRPFRVTSDVLVPRPETEHLVETILAWVRKTSMDSPNILDIGTGSGCLAVTLACEIPEARVVATDMSIAALAVARENAKENGVASRIELLQGDLFEPVQQRNRFDIVVSNPPYVETSVEQTLQPEVRDYEPPLALFAGADGLAVLQRLCSNVQERLASPGCFVCEFGHGQWAAVRSRLEQSGDWASLELIRDLQGLERGVFAQCQTRS